MIRQLLDADRKNIVRDPTYLFLLCAPLLIGLLLRLGIPFFFSFVKEKFGIELSPYREYIYAFFLQLPAYLAGMMVGMLLLEERDEGVLTAWAATPLGRGGYILYRIGFAFAAAGAAEFILLFFIPPGDGAAGMEYVIQVLPLVIAYSGGAPLILLLFALFARDKVSGLAMAKLTGVVLAMPFLIFIPAGVPGRLLIYLLFPVWNILAFLEIRTGGGWYTLLLSGVSLILQGGLVWAGTQTLIRAAELPLRPGRKVRRGG
jgi:fluoroquinolone transport system permease protein